MRVSTVEFFSRRGRKFYRAYIVGANSTKVPMPAREFVSAESLEEYLASLMAAHSTHEALAKVRRV